MLRARHIHIGHHIRHHTVLYGTIFSAAFYLSNCQQIYEPPAIKAANNYLVVDGLINIGAGTISTINLNRTRNLSDSVSTGIPELDANVSIVSSGGMTYPLLDTANNGTYTSQPLSLDNSQQYRIAVTVSDRRKYQSDLVVCTQTPPIDSITWKQPVDLTFYVSSHDPTARTRWYKWEYAETWEHDAALQSPWTVVNGYIVATDSSNQKSQCWTTMNSTNIIIGNSVALSQDIIDRYPIYTLVNGDPKIALKYSILVKQYALTEDAYDYWQLIQKTSQGLGTLFDLQPTQLIGNIHCLSDPAEPVIGFTSATTIQQKRLFLYHTNLTGWPPNEPGYNCDTMEIAVDSSNYFKYSYPDPYWAPYYFLSSSGPLMLGSAVCLDCTYLGGTTVKPPYWQ
jgi:hypothetical protein